MSSQLDPHIGGFAVNCAAVSNPDVAVTTCEVLSVIPWWIDQSSLRSFRNTVIGNQWCILDTASIVGIIKPATWYTINQILVMGCSLPCGDEYLLAIMYMIEAISFVRDPRSGHRILSLNGTFYVAIVHSNNSRVHLFLLLREDKDFNTPPSEADMGNQRTNAMLADAPFAKGLISRPSTTHVQSTKKAKSPSATEFHE